jgi:alpha-ketoglutaric semialdehyde dehydrogenase
MTIEPVLIDGTWRGADSVGEFQANNPKTKEALPHSYPISSWADCDAALESASNAFNALQQMPASRIAEFLRAFATGIEARADELVAAANAETALPVSPRLADVELPRTTGQLRKAADAAESGTWAMPTIDTATGIRSVFAGIGPVCVFGPNNFPFAFNSISGGDFAAALAAGNPVIAKANSSHPRTTQIFAEIAHEAAQGTKMPPGTVQLLYRLKHEVGERLVADPRTGATGYTGSRHAGLALKRAADAVGKPIFLELSSINPVVIMQDALDERGDDLAAEFSGSCLMGAGQFCTNPGMVVLPAGDAAEKFVAQVTAAFKSAPVGTLLSASVESSLATSVGALAGAGAELLVGGEAGAGIGYSFANSVLRVDGDTFLANAEALQQEAFGNVSLLLVAADVDQIVEILSNFEGNLTGCIYSANQAADEVAYSRVATALRPKVGRLLNDKMPTGVAVSPAMNHGGPYPATGHPGFTAVGIPGALRRFAALHCYDNVRPHRLPVLLQDANTLSAWRDVDGDWTQNPL